MRYLTSPALAFLLAVSVLAVAAPSPMSLLGRLAAQDRFTYEVQIQGEPAFQLKGERIVHHPSGLITVEQEGVPVAAFSAYQLTYVVRVGVTAEREFEVKTTDGAVHRFDADRITFDPSNLVRLEAGGVLVGILWNNNLRYVVATDALP